MRGGRIGAAGEMIRNYKGKILIVFVCVGVCVSVSNQSE